MDNITRFELTLKALNSFGEREGHLRVPAIHTEFIGEVEVPLGAWVGYLRQRRRKGQLSAARIASLESLSGWQWGPLRPGPSTNSDRNVRIMELHSSGKSLRQIADQFCVTPQAVSLMLSRHKKTVKSLRGATELTTLSSRAANALGRLNVRNREEARRMNVIESLKGSRNCGRKTISEIEHWLDEGQSAQ